VHHAHASEAHSSFKSSVQWLCVPLRDCVLPTVALANNIAEKIECHLPPLVLCSGGCFGRPGDTRGVQLSPGLPGCPLLSQLGIYICVSEAMMRLALLLRGALLLHDLFLTGISPPLAAAMMGMYLREALRTLGIN
jgi:hypothetical protein